MVEAETRRFLLVNRLGKYQDKFGDEGITDLNSLNKYCMNASVQDLETTIGMKPIQARALIDLMTNESHPRSPRAKPPPTSFATNNDDEDGGGEEDGSSPSKSIRKKPLKSKAVKVEISPELKRYLVANKCGSYCDGLVEMDILTLTKLTEFCEQPNASQHFMATPMSLSSREAKELVSLFTNPKNINSPKAKASLRTPAAEAAARVLKEEEVIKAEEKRLIAKAKGERIANEREKRLQREAEILAENKRIEEELRRKEEEEKRKEEESSEAALERKRIAEEKKKAEEQAKYLAKADRILELQLAREKALQVRDSRAEEKKRLEDEKKRIQEEQDLELSIKLSKLQGMVRRNKAQEVVGERKKSRDRLVEVVQQANRHRVARKELYFRQLQRFLSADFEYGETPSKSLLYRIDTLNAALDKFRKLHRKVQKPEVLESPDKELSLARTVEPPKEEVDDTEPKVEEVSEMIEEVEKKPIEERTLSTEASTSPTVAVVVDTSKLSKQDLLIYNVEERVKALKTRQRDIVLTLKCITKLETFVLPPTKKTTAPTTEELDLDEELSPDAAVAPTELSAEKLNQISALEAAKASAVEKEDFATAQALKFEIDDLKQAFNMNASVNSKPIIEVAEDNTQSKEEEEDNEDEDKVGVEESEEEKMVNAFIAALQTVITAADGSVPLKSLTVLYAAKTKLLKLQDTRAELLRNRYALKAQKEAELEAKRLEAERLKAEEEERKKKEEKERIKKIEEDAKARAKAAEIAALEKLKELEEEKRLAEIAEQEAEARRLKELEALEKEKEKLEKQRLADIAEKKRIKKEEAAMALELQKAAEEAERLRIEEEKAEIAEQKSLEAKERIREAKAKQAEEAQRRLEAEEEAARLAREAIKKPVVVMKQIKTTFKVGQRVYGCHSDDEEWYVAHVHAVRMEENEDGEEVEYYDLIYEGFEEDECFEENKTIDEVCHPREFDDDIEEEKPQRRKSSVKAPVVEDKPQMSAIAKRKEEEKKKKELEKKNSIKEENVKNNEKKKEEPEQKLVKKASSSSEKPAIIARQGSFNNGQIKRRGSKKEDPVKEAARLAEEEEEKKRKEEEEQAALIEAKKHAEETLMNLVQDTSLTLPQKLTQLAEINEQGVLKPMGEDAFANAKVLVLSANHFHKTDENSANDGGGGGGRINLSDLTPKEIKKMEKEMKKRRKTELKLQAKQEKEDKKRRQTEVKLQLKEEKEEKKRLEKEEKELKKQEKGRKSVAARLSVFW